MKNYTRVRECEQHMRKIIHIMNDPNNKYQHRQAIANMVQNFTTRWSIPEDICSEPDAIIEYFIMRLNEVWAQNCIDYEKKYTNILHD